MLRPTIFVAISTLFLGVLTLRAQSAEPAGNAPLEPSSSGPPASAIERLDRYRTAMREARGRSDWAGYLAGAREVKELLNASPQSRLEVARAETHLGKVTTALDELTAYVRMGQASEVLETLPDFAPLRERKEFEAVRTSMTANKQVVSLASVAFHIPDSGLLPEDIDFDARTQRFFLSSVLQHRIVTIAGDGPLTEFAHAPDDWPIMAIRIDAQRKVLWATQVALEDFDAVAKADQGRSVLLCYDLDSGKLLRRIEGPRPSSLGDMEITAQGDLIVSDGGHGGLYRLRQDADRLERLDRGDFISPQTVAMAPDGTHIYVPDYVRGLGVLDLGTRQVRWVPMDGRHALHGIDGLYRNGESLVAIQNGASPERVVLFSMDASATKVVAEQAIERATATLGDPTHGVIVDGVFYYIANSGWDAMGDNGLVKAGAKLTEAVVMKWKLPPAASKRSRDPGGATDR